MVTINDDLPQPKRKVGRPRKEGISPTICKRKDEGLTALQVQFLLDPESVHPSPKTWGCWKCDPNFTNLLELVKQARAMSTATMVEKARTIVADALAGKMGSDENDRLRVDVAWKLVQAYPEKLVKKVVFKGWRDMNTQTIPQHKMRRILEEIENDKSVKKDLLPIDYIGHTKLGSPTNRESGSEERMREAVLLEGEYDTFEEEAAL